MWFEILKEVAIAVVHSNAGLYTYGTIAFVSTLVYWRYRAVQQNGFNNFKAEPLPFTEEEEQRQSVITDIVKWLSDTKQEAEWLEKASKLCGYRNFADNGAKRLLVIINPQSGFKTAKPLFMDNVLPVLLQCGFQRECLLIVETERSKHATDLVRQYDLDSIDGILACGGDGTQSEVFYGLYLHENRKKAFNTPVGAIPCGSGNHIASLIDEWTTSQYHTGDPSELVSMALRVSGGQTMPVDLLEMDVSEFSGKRTRCTSAILMLQGSGVKLMVDAERLRWTRLGIHRYTIASMMNWRSKTFDFEITYLPADSEQKVPDFDEWEENDEWKNVEQTEFSSVMSWATMSRVMFRQYFDRYKGKESMRSGILYFFGVKEVPGQKIPEMTTFQAKAITVRTLGENEVMGGTQTDGEQSPTYFAKEVRAKICADKPQIFV